MKHFQYTLLKVFTLCLLLLLFFSCSDSNELKTPSEFVNNVIVQDSIYLKDLKAITSELKRKLKAHTECFTNPEYNDSTFLIIDTIIYDYTLSKIATLIIAKIPSHRNPYSISDLPYYYNANCYLGKRINSDSTSFVLECIGPVSLINFSSKYETQKAIRESYFLDLTKHLDEKKSPAFEYNIIDKRFWNSPKGWKRVFN